MIRDDRSPGAVLTKAPKKRGISQRFFFWVEKTWSFYVFFWEPGSFCFKYKFWKHGEKCFVKKGTRHAGDSHDWIDTCAFARRLGILSEPQSTDQACSNPKGSQERRSPRVLLSLCLMDLRTLNALIVVQDKSEGKTN